MWETHSMNSLGLSERKEVKHDFTLSVSLGAQQMLTDGQDGKCGLAGNYMR